MSSQTSSTLPRRSLNARQAETVARLYAAASELLDEVGHEQFTIGLVARRAGVSRATAYTYFASKEHLFAELFWRVLDATPVPEPTGQDPTSRVLQMTDHLSAVVADRPALAAAVNKGLLGSDPEVERIRLDIGRVYLRRFREALGEDADEDLVTTLVLVLSGAMLQAGVGIMSYDDLASVMRVSAQVVMRGHS